MHKLNRILSTCLLTATAIVSLPNSLPTMAQSNTSGQFFWWQRFQANPPVDEGPGGKRGFFCAIAPRPVNTDTQVWSNRPLFVWQGDLANIGLRVHGDEKIFWSQPIVGANNYVSYTGDALEPGQTYDWVILSSQNNPMMFFPFKVMEAPERDRIRVRLTILEQELKDKGATPEEIAMQRANFFAQQELWSDVLKEVYSIRERSPELENILEQIPGQLCENQG